jgi:photosystem II stability/assembly factor-like uncharacterized protein
MASNLDAVNGTKLFVMQGGPGREWQIIQDESSLDAITGGGVTWESDFARGKYVGRRKTSNPADYSTTIRARSQAVSNELRKMAKQTCPGLIAVFYGCPGVDITRFSMAKVLIDGTLDAGPLSNEGMSYDGIDGANAKILDSFPVTAPGGDGGEILYPVAHNVDVTLVQVADHNDIIALKSAQCAGDCGDEITVDDEFIAVGGPVAPATIPRIHYRARLGGAWKSMTLTGITDGIAVSVTKVGDRILIGVTGTSAGLWAVSYEAILAATTSVAATQVSPTVITAAVNAVLAIDAKWVYAGGPSGALYVSSNGGYSFTALTSGTVENILRIAARDADRVYFGAANGVLLQRLNKASINAISPSVIAADDVTALAVPERGTEIHLGTDTGEWWKSIDGGTNWTRVNFTGDGVGVIVDIKFIGVRGLIAYIVQNDATPDGRVLVDYSGGSGGSAVKALGTYTSPPNNSINRIAPSSVNYALAVGDIAAVNGFVGEIKPT